MTIRNFNKIVKDLFPIIKIENHVNYMIYFLKEANQEYCFSASREDIENDPEKVIKEMFKEYMDDYKIYIYQYFADYGIFS